MGLFTTREPRKFRRVSIYTDDSRDKLQKLVNDVKREQGLLNEEEKKDYDPTKFNGTFSEFTPRAKDFKENGPRVGWPLAIILIVALAMVWRFLITGQN